MTDTLLYNKRIRLRPLEPEDLELLYTLENDTALWDCSTTNVPYSRYALKQFIASTKHDIYTDRQLRLLIDLADTHETVGMVDLVDFEPLHLRAEVGIVILQHFRGQNIAKEALALLCQYAHVRLHIHQLYAYVAAQNAPCRTAFCTAGFQTSATLPDWLCSDGDFEDAVLLSRIF